jgi:hypothetical protein
VLVARAAIGAAVLAIIALAALHLLKPDVDPARTMISRYALGRHGWMMSLCFAAFATASACLFAALIGHASSLLSRTGMALLLIAAAGLAMAAVFPMDPEWTAPAQRSLSGKMHGLAFMLGVPCQVLSVLLLSVALGGQTPHAAFPLFILTATVWLSLIVMIAIMAMVGPAHGPSPSIPRVFGWANRALVVSYGVWLILAAWPMAQ